MLVASPSMSAWRQWCARWSGAEAALVVAWAAFAAGLLADALARESLGAGLLAAFCAWQMSDVWAAVHAAPDDPERPGARALGSK
jgi:hypothetical protein